MTIFRCPVEGCDATFVNGKDLERHVKESEHCEKCGGSDAVKYNPLDYEDCDDCDLYGQQHE